MPAERQRGVQSAVAARAWCTVCGAFPPDPRPHPTLRVPVCPGCVPAAAAVANASTDELCRWCGDGGDLFLCDHCPGAFCKRCIFRNLGRERAAAISEAAEWTCFLCDPRPLAGLLDQRVATQDLSGGRESAPVAVVGAKLPPRFVYVTDYVGRPLPPLAQGCAGGSRGDCSDCDCARCTDACRCHARACQRRPQTIVRLRLQVFAPTGAPGAPGAGVAGFGEAVAEPAPAAAGRDAGAEPEGPWALRCRDAVPAGTFVARYLGLRDGPQPTLVVGPVSVDARAFGNVARFMRHSTDPAIANCAPRLDASEAYIEIWTTEAVEGYRELVLLA